MMAKKKTPAGDYPVGYCKPPKAHQFRKGTSGNPRGAPRKKKQEQTDIPAILNAPVTATVDGKQRRLSPFEAGLRKRAKKAVDGHFPSILRFIRICEEYGIQAPPAADQAGGVAVAPKGSNFFEWFEGNTEPIPKDEL